MSNLVIVSADSHAGITGETYRPYFDPAYRDAVDFIVEDNETWYAGLRAIGYPFSPQVLDVVDTRRAIRSGGDAGYYDPVRRLQEAEAEGVCAEVLHPGGPIGNSAFADPGTRNVPPEVRAAGVRAHNRWLAEFCSADPERLVGVALIWPWPDINAAVEQTIQAREAGLKAVYAPFAAGLEDVLPGLWDRFWDPFFAACVDAGMPIDIHAGFALAPGSGEAAFQRALSRSAGTRAVATGELFDEENLFPTKRVVWQLIWGGALDRFPDLKVVISEVHAEWVGPTLDYLDRFHAESDTPLLLKPREYWERNFAVVATNPRRAEIQMRHHIGVTSLMIGTDFPHVEGTWPNTIDWLRVVFAGVPEDEARLVLGENAISLYGLNSTKLKAVADRVGPSADDILAYEGVVDPRLIDHFEKRSGFLKEPDFDKDFVARSFDEDRRRIAVPAER